MTIYPELQRRLVAAAATEPTRRMRSRGLTTVAVLAVLLSVIAMTSSLAGDGRDTSASRLPGVPAETLAKAAKYATTRPNANERSQRLDADALAQVARELLDALPYPPGRQDDALIGLAAKRAEARDMSQITIASDLRAMSEYRAACTWQQFWLAAHDSAESAAKYAATTVLTTVPRWPESSYAARRLADAAGSGDVATMRRQVRLNCGSVGS